MYMYMHMYNTVNMPKQKKGKNKGENVWKGSPSLVLMQPPFIVCTEVLILFPKKNRRRRAWY